jgi:ABC-type Fe3+-hydroxamate transport system substrate-binding protein
MRYKQYLILIAIAAMGTFGGCSSSKPDSQEAKKSSTSGEHVHDDGTVHGEGPHGGVVADWGGGKFHVEFTVDHDKQEATVYISGDDEKTAVAIDAADVILAIKKPATQVTLTPTPQDSDPQGKSSRFVGKHENLGTVMEYEGSISGVVNGTPYSGNFKEVAHDH